MIRHLVGMIISHIHIKYICVMSLYLANERVYTRVSVILIWMLIGQRVSAECGVNHDFDKGLFSSSLTFALYLPPPPSTPQSLITYPTLVSLVLFFLLSLFPSFLLSLLSSLSLSYFLSCPLSLILSLFRSFPLSLFPSFSPSVFLPPITILYSWKTVGRASI